MSHMRILSILFMATSLLTAYGCTKKTTPSESGVATFTLNHSDNWVETKRNGEYIFYRNTGVPVFGIFASSPAPSTTPSIEKMMTDAFTLNGNIFHIFSSRDVSVSGKNMRYVVGEWVVNGNRAATRAYAYGGPDGQAMIVAYTAIQNEVGLSGVMKEFLDGLRVSN